MKRALISRLENFRICEVREIGEEFEVADDFFWIDVPDDTTSADTINQDGTIKKFNPVEQEGFAEHAYKVARSIAYKSVGEQLDMIFKEVQANGTISADGPWATHISTIKTQIPKDDPQAVYDYVQADWAARVAEASKNTQ